jgi:hypothetical protein
MLHSVLFTVGFSNSEEIIRNILRRMEEMDTLENFYDMENPKRKRNTSLSKLYECAIPISDIARDLRVIGLEYGFTIISTQLTIVLGMFLEFLCLEFIKDIKDIKDTMELKSRKILIQDVIKAKDVTFAGFDIPFNEDVFAECLLQVPFRQLTIVEKVNSFPIPMLKNKR